MTGEKKNPHLVKGLSHHKKPVQRGQSEEETERCHVAKELPPNYPMRGHLRFLPT